MRKNLTFFRPRNNMLRGQRENACNMKGQIFGLMWTRKEFSDKISALNKELFYSKRELLEVVYIAKKQKVKLPKWFCKKCFYAWPARQENPPQKCANDKGYIDKDGVFHEKCGSRHWDQWADNFDPQFCTNSIALSIWYGEQEDEYLPKAVNE